MVFKLRNMDEGPEAEWLANQLERFPHLLDDDALKHLCSLVESGGKNRDQAMKVLVSTLMRWAGSSTPENLRVLLAPDVQEALVRASVSYIERHAGDSGNAQRLLADGDLNASTKLVASKVVANPSGDVTEIWLGLLAAHVDRLRTLSDSDQQRLVGALLKVVRGQDPASSDLAKKILATRLLSSQLPILIRELMANISGNSSLPLLAVLLEHAEDLGGMPPQTRNELAQGLLKIAEEHVSDASVRAQVSTLVGSHFTSTLPQQLVDRLEKPGEAEITELHFTLIRAMASQVTPPLIKRITALAAQEGAQQAGLKQLERFLVARSR
jgi:hypothetical protein